VSRRALAQLVAHDWPGNIRELESAIERAVTRCPNGSALEAAHFDLTPTVAVPPPASLQSRRESVERDAIDEALDPTKGNKSKASGLLGISRQALYKRLGRRKRDK
jgi:transcriptional regulator of acetoin/glycerol metabolism